MRRMSSRISCGRDFHCVPDINSALDSACKAGYDFICLPIVHPRFRREFISGPSKKRSGALTRSDMSLSSQDWSSLIVGKISPWLQVDSPHLVVRKNSEMAFKQELMYAAHLSMPSVLLSIKGPNIVNLARCLNEHLISSYFQQHFWIHVPLTSSKDQVDDVFDNGGMKNNIEQEFDDTWEWWNTFRTLCDSNKRLGVALELTADLPSTVILNRWIGEPVKVLILSTSIFITNKKGYPVLSKQHQTFVRQMFKLDIQMIVTGADRHSDKGLRSYQQYLDHLFQTQPQADQIGQFAKGYEDYLQSPLQPLMDNLESQTYEIFERDPVKYSQYQKAVYYALLDKISESEKDQKKIVLMVVGAGRGPLVRAALAAAQQADRQVKKLYAVEKNPNAVVTLENLKDEMWGELVDVISCDMRVWEAPEKADILISELLGSFGDNELSPECLDGAQRFLKDDGISIPCEYTSYLAPLQSPKLYNEVRASKEKDQLPGSPFEKPYVVRLHNCHVLTEPKSVFTFHHPNKDEVIDNNRYISLEFQAEFNCVVHGFAGYFETILYKNITLSILPSTHSPGMFSWFPILFPIKTPMNIKAGNKIIMDIWRRCTDKNVWYEWTIRSPFPIPIHNPKGRSYTIGL
ncbi:hypothetical protein LOTGIDRAFT_194048 [Lottia gigantea]|uniref:Protein arginine N-methyltransferase n=1 Tax=Lottia gigantea TaxID=225164 RepID=V3ZAC9_LOTGI|nr:hypothetical protein LOTGIDRAFT_194048 [Lottia gigantea]ESO87913.1 hypothetical protein LOTGIDRAFT_194048 [Lottia gigantea]